MEIIKIFKGGYINENQVTGDDGIIDRINTIKTNVIFDRTENIFKKEEISDELIVKEIKSNLEAELTKAMEEREKATKEREIATKEREIRSLRASLVPVYKYLDPDTPPDMKIRYKSDILTLYNRILLKRQDEIRRTKKDDYINIFNSIVPFQPNSVGNLFSFIVLV